jgi:hypothetical protein
MQPIGNIWNKFPRTVRDVATACCKQVRIEMEGQETEMDKTIIEAIKDPLTHLVRNCVDHGIETPERSTAAGKPLEGLLRLRAFHEGGQVHIEIIDDGGGLDGAKIRDKAVQRGLLTAQRGAQLSEREAVNLIFMPGVFHCRKSNQRFRAGRRHGRGENQHRENRRHCGCAEPTREGHHGTHENPADTGHHPCTHSDLRRRPLCHPTGKPAGTGAYQQSKGRLNH